MRQMPSRPTKPPSPKTEPDIPKEHRNKLRVHKADCGHWIIEGRGYETLHAHYVRKKETDLMYCIIILCHVCYISALQPIGPATANI